MVTGCNRLERSTSRHRAGRASFRPSWFVRCMVSNKYASRYADPSDGGDQTGGSDAFKKTVMEQAQL
jgi:hypothetical protein